MRAVALGIMVGDKVGEQQRAAIARRGAVGV
jgi:hypothetical protein